MRNKHYKKYLFMAPAFIGIIVFSIIPIAMSVYQSFFDSPVYGEKTFIGFGNYANALNDRYFITALKVGMNYAIIVVPVLIILSFLLANLLYGLKGKVSSFVKTSIYIPTVISSVIASMIFIFMYDFQAGILNNALAVFHIDPVAWLTNTKIVLFSLAAPRVWLSFGYTTLFILGGLLDIPKEVFEAAKIDGVSWIQKMRYITIPSIKNVLVFLFVSNIISNIQEFDLPFNMTGGGPAGASQTPTVYIFNHFVNDPKIGLSLAAAVMVAIVLGLASVTIFKVVKVEKNSL